MGLITALRLFASRDHKLEMQKYETICRSIEEGLKNVTFVKASYLPIGDFRTVPLVKIKFLNVKDPREMIQIDSKLKEKNPPIYLETSRIGERILLVNPFNLNGEDADLIVNRIKQIG